MQANIQKWDLIYLNDLIEFSNSWEISKNMADCFPGPYTLITGRTFIEKAASDFPLQAFAIIVNEKAVGSIVIVPQTDIYCKNAELGYWLSTDYWGNGVMTEAISQILKYAFMTWQIERIFAKVFSHNSASKRVLEKNGFLLEATFRQSIFKGGEYTDELFFAIRRQAYQSPANVK